MTSLLKNALMGNLGFGEESAEDFCRRLERIFDNIANGNAAKVEVNCKALLETVIFERRNHRES